MKADPRGIVLALRRAVSQRKRREAEWLTEVIVEHLERLDRMDEAGAYIPRPTDQGD